MTGPDATAANRPVRQRNAVLHYSDDNPNTFTVKKRNGVIIDGPASLLATLTTATTTTTRTSPTNSTTAPRRLEARNQEPQEAVGPSRRIPTPRADSGISNDDDDDDDDDIDPDPTTSGGDSRRPRGSRPRPPSSAAGSVASSVASSTASASRRKGASATTTAAAAGAASSTAVGKTGTARTGAVANKPSGAASSAVPASVLSGAARTGSGAAAEQGRRGSAASSRGSSERESKSNHRSRGNEHGVSGGASTTSSAASTGRTTRGVANSAVAGASDARGRSSSNSRKRPPLAASAAGATMTTATHQQQQHSKPPPRRSSSLGTASSSPSSSHHPSRKRKTRPLSPSEKLSGMYGGLHNDGDADDAIHDGEGDNNGAGELARGTVIDHQLFYQPLIEATQRRGSGGASAGGLKLLLQPPGLAYAASGGGSGSAAPPSLSAATSSASVGSAAAALALSSAVALGRPRPLRFPTRLSSHQELLQDPPVTCWASRPVAREQLLRPGRSGAHLEATPQWVACGDGSGRVHLASLRPRTAIFASIETAASRRERERAISSRKSTVTFPNAVLAVAWSATESVVAVLTDAELECIDLLARDAPNDGPAGGDRGFNGSGSGRSAGERRDRAGAARLPYSFIPLSDQAQGAPNSIAAVTVGGTLAVSQPTLEWQGDRLLWVLGNGPCPSPGELSNCAVHGSGSPSAYVIQRGSAPLRPIPLPCLAATWDDPTSDHPCDRLLALIRRGKDTLALVRYDFQSEQTIQSVELSLSGSVRRVHLQKHHVLVSDGSNQRTTATLVTLCTPRGVHVHSGETLECLSIVGESVALHGKSVSWESCQLVPEPCLDGRRLNPSAAAASKGAQKQKCWWQLQVGDSNDRSNELPLPSYQLVAAPQPFKEPKELQSTIHIWRAPQSKASDLQSRFSFHLQHATTLPIPSSPGGILGWTISYDRMGGWRVLGVSAEFGSAFEWNSRFLTDFAGREYPVGYKLLSDNIEYLEDEDEMDQGMEYYDADPSFPSSPSSMAPLFATPPRPSTVSHSKELEQALKLSAEEEPIEVLLSADDEEHDQMEIDSCPPLVIQVDKNRTCEATASEGQVSGDVQGTTSASEPSKTAPLLMCFPQCQDALEVSKTQPVEGTSSHLSAPTAVELEAAVANACALQLKRGKKSRVASVETVLQASVLPDLRSRMNVLMHLWGDGSGSSCAVVGGASLSNFSATRSPNRTHARTSQPDFAQESADSQNADPLLLQANEDAMELELETVDRPAQQPDPMQLESATEAPEKVDAKVPGTPSKVAELGTGAGAGSGAGALPPESSHYIDSRLEQRQWSARELDRMSPSVTSKVSAEERELALELLLLSPGHQRPLPPNGSPQPSTHPVSEVAESQNGQPKKSSFCDSGPADAIEEATVTPSEQSPTNLRGPGSLNPPDQSDASVDFCAACFGRMVVHRCGKREKPIDYDAIERAERERREREEAEKQQRRTEKRRAAEARRREARKKKKEEDDQKRFEEEEREKLLEAKRIQQHEAQRSQEIEVERLATGQAGPMEIHSVQEESTPSRGFNNWKRESFQPSFSPLKSQVGPRPESPAATPHGFRPLDASVGTHELLQRSGADATTSSPKPASEHVRQPSGSTHMRNGIDEPSSVHAGFATTAHGFSQTNESSSSTIESAVPTGTLGSYTGSKEPYSTNDDRAHAQPNPPVDGEYTSGSNADAGVEINTQGTHSMSWSNARATSPSHAAGTGLDVTKLEPSAPLSTADALEALAGLANSLPAVPTNVSHNFSSRTWGHQSYEHVPLEQSVHHQPHPNHYFEDQSRYHYQHTGPYSYATDGAANLGQAWGASPSFYGHGSTAAHGYPAMEDYSSAAPSGPLVSAAPADTSGSSSLAMDDSTPPK